MTTDRVNGAALSGAQVMSALNTGAAAGKPTYTIDQIADYLTDGYWADTSQSSRAFDVTTGGEITYKVTGLTADGQMLAEEALEAWSNVLGITFVEVTEGAQIIFDDLDPSGAYTTSRVTDGEIQFSYVNIPVNWINSYGTTIDSYSFQTYIHEIGHALGLGHAGDYNGTGNFYLDAAYTNDSWQATIMSYFSQTDNPYVDASYAALLTPMMADIVAVGNLYGYSTTVNTGDTVYGANSNVGGYMGELYGILFDGDAANPALYDGGPVAFTINDDGGIDTLDFSTVDDDQNINLNPETPSDAFGLTGNVIIGRGTVIENALTGGGDDTLTGNDVANTLSSGAGKDKVLGAGGNDHLDTGTGNDIAGGGAGADEILGGAGVDLLFGGDNGDTVLGGAGNDFVFGGNGADTLIGEGGNDKLFGGADADMFSFDFSASGEKDTIRDFQDGLDVVVFTNTGADFGELDITDSFAGAVVDYGGSEIVLTGISAADLTSDDFLFIGAA